jgi:hypothetical protein
VSFGFCWNRHETATLKNLWWVFPLQWCHRYSYHVLTLHILWARVFSSHCWRWFFDCFWILKLFFPALSAPMAF